MLEKAQKNLNLSKVIHRFTETYKGQPVAIVNTLDEFNELTASLYDLGLSYNAKIDRSKKHPTKYYVTLLVNYQQIDKTV